MHKRIVHHLSIAILCSSLSSGAIAHHSAGPFYDVSRAAEVAGEVVRVRWVNPHVSVELRVVDDDGSEQIWKVEGAAINTLERQGLTAESLSIGDSVRAVGYESRRGRPEMFAGILYLADGREVVLADGIAVDLGILNEQLNTGRVISDVAEASGSAPRERTLFRVWSRRGDGYPELPETGLAYTPEVLAAQEAWDPLQDDTGLQCIPQGMPGVMVNPYPVEFIDQGDEIILRVEEWDTVRTIHMTATPAENPESSSLGYSVGRWEGDTLVVETTAIGWPYFDDIGTPQTQAMQVEERFTLSQDGTRLDYVQRAFDPFTFTEPAILTGYFWIEDGAEVKPFNCVLD